MPEPGLAEAVATLVQRLLALAADDPELRSCLRALAQQVLAATEPAESTAQGPPSVAGQPAVQEAAPAVPAEAPAAQADARPSVPEETRAAVGAMPAVFPATAPAPAPIPAMPTVRDVDLPVVAKRCRLKADAARWTAKRQRLIAEGVDFQTEIKPSDHDIIEKAKKLPDCFLWMSQPLYELPKDLGLLEDLAGCFEATADAIDLVCILLGEPEKDAAESKGALLLLAEAQSALRAAAGRAGYGKPDNDQQRTYEWLRDTCWTRQVYVARHMKIDDPADAGAWRLLRSRIEASVAEVHERQRLRKQHDSRLARISYHQKLLLSGGGADPAHDWQVLIDTVDKMVGDGTPPSNTALRELLLPLNDKVPDVLLPPGFCLAMREVEDYLATRPAPQVEEAVVEATDEVKRVTKWLTGKTLVLIGGVPRPHAREALKRAFGLKEVDWIETREHESFLGFEANVSRADVAVVLLAIRWCSHGFEAVKKFCDQNGKPLVRLPGGYNPNQVAIQIVRQCL